MANRIRELRGEYHMSQEQLARTLQVHQTLISQWEHERTEPSFDAVCRMAQLFNVDVTYLMGTSDARRSFVTHDGDYTDPWAEPALVNNDPELTAYLEELRTRPEMRMLFSVAAHATKADVEKAVAIIEALRKTEDN